MTVSKSRYKIFRPVMVSSSGVSSKNRSSVVFLCINNFYFYFVFGILYFRNVALLHTEESGLSYILRYFVLQSTLFFVFVFSLSVFT